jgi:phosphoserine phosphatase RsbU/P
MSNWRPLVRHTSGGWPVTTDDVMVDVSHDWLQACSVQERFMRGPARNQCRVDYSASCRQMRALGGDCYDFFCPADGQLAILVGDASGKGVAAALMIASVQASLRTAALFTGSDLTALLRAVNAQACASSLAARYATLFYAVLDQTADTLRYVNAGHNPPVIFHGDGSIDWLEPGGPPVGLFPDATWQERVVRLQPGDRLLAYTDGVTEACGPSGEEWGSERLLQAMNGRGTESADQLVWSILASLDDFSQGVQTDDATVAVLRVL